MVIGVPTSPSPDMVTKASKNFSLNKIISGVATTTSLAGNTPYRRLHHTTQEEESGEESDDQMDQFMAHITD